MHYRIYTFREDGHFSRVQRIECADEGQALREARELVVGQGAELWENAKLIARFPEPAKTPE
jgi:hypothetical protein